MLMNGEGNDSMQGGPGMWKDVVKALLPGHMNEAA